MPKLRRHGQIGMHKAVIDTNILVSALLSPEGLPARVLDLVLTQQLTLCYDSRIIAEYENVLNRPKFGFDGAGVKELVDILIELGLSIVPVPSTIPMPDEDDRKFYDVAKTCGALLVTGNRKHFPDEEFVVSASELFTRLGAAE